MSKVYKTGFVVTGDASGGVKAMKATREEMDKLGETQKKSKAQWAEAAKAQRLATAAAASSDSQFNALNSTLKNTVSALAGIAGVSFTVQGLTQSISDAKSLRDAVNQVGTLLDDTSGMEAYRKNIVEMGKEWGDTEKQASALYNIVSAGHSGLTESARILEQANILAMGGVTDVFVATDGLTSALNAYNKTASSAADVSDSFFVAMKYGKTNIEELAGSIGTVAPIAATAGASLDELMAAAAAITSTGVSTSEAMVQLKGVMLELINPAEQSAKFAKEIGLEFNTAALKAKGLSGFLAELTEKTGGSEEAMGRLFGNSRALSGVMSLTGATADKFGSALDAMTKKAGESEVAMNKLAVGAEFALDMIAIKLDALKLEVGEGALDALEPSLIFINENFDELISTTAFLTKTTVGLFAAYKLGPPVMSAVTRGTLAMSAATQAHTAKTLAATTATHALRIAMLALPHVAVAAGVAAVVYAFTQYNNQQKETIALADKARAKVATYNAEQNSVEGLQARLKAEEEALAATLATAAAHEEGASQAAQSLEKLQKMIDSGDFSGGTLDALVQNYDKIKESIDSTSDKAESGKQRIADLRDALAELGVQTADTAEKLGGIGKAGVQTSEQSEAIDKLTTALVDQYTKLALGERAYLDYQLAQQSATAAQREQALAAFDSIASLKAAQKAQEDYAAALAISAEESVSAFADIETQSQRVWESLAQGKITAEQAAVAIAGIASAGASSEKELKDFADSVLDSLEPLREVEQQMTQVWAAFDAGHLDAEQVADYTKTFTQETKKVESAASKAAERIDAEFAKAWSNLDGGFGGLVDGIKNAFTSMLAEMAHEALTKPIMLSIQSNLGGAAGGMGAVAGGAIAAAALVTVAAINSHNKKDDERMLKYTAEYRQGQQSTGTVLGDIDAKSHSLSNLTESLVEMGTDSLDVNHGMLRSLQAIESGIKGVSQGIARQLSSAGGLEDFESTTSTSSIVDAGAGLTKAMLNPFGSGLDKIGLGFIDDFLGGLIGGISKGIYSKKKTLQDAGIDFANQSLGAIIDSGFVEADAYQRIKTTRKTLGVKKSSTSKETSDLDDAIQYQLGGIFSNAAGVLGDVGTELGLEALNYSKTIGSGMFGMQQKTLEMEMGLQDFIENLEIDAGELSLKGLKGEELSAEIESFISSNLDNWAESMLAAADMEGVAAQYQQAGEGVFETLGRLVAQSKNLQQAAERLNLQFNASGLEAAELTQSLAGIAGGFGNLQVLTSAYYQEYFSDAEKQADLQRDLTRAFAEYNAELPKSKEEFRALVESVDLTTESGQQAYVALMNVQAPFSQFVKELEKTKKELEKAKNALLEVGFNATLSVYLIDAAGGMEQFISSMSSFVDKFAPESHRLDLLSADMERSLAAVGLSVPETRDEMWQLMQSLDATTEAGADQVATLLRLTGTADAYYKMLESGTGSAAAAVQNLSQALQDFVRNTQNSTQSLKTQLMQLQGDTEGVRNATRASIRAALNDQLNAAKAQLSALKEQQAAAAAAEREAAAAVAAEREAAASSRADVAGQIAGQIAAAEQQLAEYKNHADALSALLSGDPAEAFIDGIFHTTAELAKGLDYWNQKVADAEEALNTLGADSGTGADSGDLAAQIEKLQNEIKAAENASAAQLAAQEAIWKEEDAQAAAQIAAAIAQQRAQLQTQELQLLGDLEAIRAAELTQIHESNQEIQQRIWALQDAQAAEQQAAAVAEKRFDLENQLLRLQGNELAAVAREREKELDALRQLSPELVELQKQIWAAHDAVQGDDGLDKYLQKVADFAQKELQRIEGDYQERIKLAEEQMRIGRELRQYVEQLRISELSPYDPGEKLELATEQFAALLVRAEAGDMEAARLLQSSAQAYLQNADSYYGRSGPYLTIFEEVTRSMDRLGLDIIGGLDDSTIERLNQQMLTEQQRIRDYAEQELRWAQDQAHTLTGIQGLLSNWPDQFKAMFDGFAGSVSQAIANAQPARPTGGGTGGGSGSGTGGGSGSGTGGIAAPPDEQRSFYDRAVEGGISHDVAKGWSGLPENTVKALDKALTSGGRIPAFAKGGDHIGGIRLVGERGPELEVTGPSRIFNADDTRKILAGDNAKPQVIVQTDPALITELQQLRAEVVQLRSEQSRFSSKAEQQRSDQQQAMEAVVRASKSAVGVI